MLGGGVLEEGAGREGGRKGGSRERKGIEGGIAERRSDPLLPANSS